MESKRRRVYAIIAGVCFILLGIYEAFLDFDSIATYGVYVSSFPGLFGAVCSIVSGILWLVRKKKFPFFLLVCMYCVAWAFYHLSILAVISDGDSFQWHWYTVSYAVGMIAFLVFLFVVIITYIPATKEKPKSRVRNIVYIVPGFLMVLVLLMDLLCSDWDFLISFAFYEDVLTILALFTGCLWLKDCHTPIFQKKAPAPVAPVIGRAARLQQYKDLLDAGVLTQAEFDAKKAEILHL